MATPTVHGHNAESNSIIAGYFQNGEDAHRAINALLDEGFLPSQIGAAFHTSGAVAGNTSREEIPVFGGDSMRESLGTTISQGTSGIPEAISGAASDTTAVQPGALIGGAGTNFGGAGKPGPISGSSLENTGLPSELEHSLPHDSEVASSARTSPAASAPYTEPTPVPPPHAGSGPQHHVGASHGSWTSKLRHLFSSDKGKAAAQSGTATEQSQNFGTGEGQLNLPPYSASRFETAATGAGLHAEQSRHLSRRLAAGGAIVTVSVTGRGPEVERIFERHHGIVKFEGGNFEDAATSQGQSQFEVFGNLENHYAGSV